MIRRKNTRGAGYIHGLGDGHVEEKKQIADDAEQDAVLKKALRRNKNPLRDVNRGERIDGWPGDGAIALPGKDMDSAEKIKQQQALHHGRHYHHQRPNIWNSFPLFVVFAIMIITFTALFLRLIADTIPENKTRRIKRRHSMVRRKKEDTWNEDAREEELLSESVRGGSRKDIDDTKIPAVYYPYQPKLQQHRHRKTSISNAASVVVASHPAQQPHSSSVQNRSYYLNQSGSAVIAGSSYTNSPKPTPGAEMTGNRIAAAHTSPKPEPKPGSTVKAQNSQVKHQHDSVFSSPTQETQQQRANMNARHLSSTVSSFESLTENLSGNHSRDSYLLGNIDASPRLKNSPHIGGDTKLNYSSATSRTPTGSAEEDEDDTPKTEQVNRLRMSDLVDRTPRACNRRQIIDTPLQQQPVPEHSMLDVSQHQGYLNGDSSMEFASPARIRQEQQRQQERNIPFVPSLDMHLADVRPPKSLNVDDLHLYQLMESGNVSHWEARVAEESRLLENKVFASSSENNNIRDRVMASAVGMSGTSTPDTIPSGDPRKSISHKRDDLTKATDAASSLQGDIDFSELKLVEVIGGGGFGQVWKAMWRGTPVAVKVLTGSAQSKSVPRAVLEEFAAEINLLKGMRHPNICLYMGACLEPPNRAIITELAAHGSLWDALRLPLTPPYVACDGQSRDGWPAVLYQPDTKHGAPPTMSRPPTAIPSRGTWHWILVKRVACGAARGMGYLHSGKPPILHRDLKSANILLDDSYTAKICDFGLSRLKAQGRSMTGNCGTVQWMAPEVLANQAYNEKADIYSYGVILWELLSRECPFDKMSPIQCALAVLNKNQRPEIPKWCPPSLQALIRACFKKDPDERPTFTQILAALDSMP